MTTRRQFLTGAVATAAALAMYSVPGPTGAANDVKVEGIGEAGIGEWRVGDVVTISGMRGKNGALQMFVVTSIDDGLTLSLHGAGESKKVRAPNPKPWPRHHKRDRWA